MWHNGSLCRCTRRARRALRSHSALAVRSAAGGPDLAHNPAGAGKQAAAGIAGLPAPVPRGAAHLVPARAVVGKERYSCIRTSVAPPGGCPRASHRRCSGDGRGDRRARACGRDPRARGRDGRGAWAGGAYPPRRQAGHRRCGPGRRHAADLAGRPRTAGPAAQGRVRGTAVLAVRGDGDEVWAGPRPRPGNICPGASRLWTGRARTGRARTGCAWATACAWADWAGTGSPCPGRLDGTSRRILARVVARGPAPCDPGSGTSRASDDRSRLWRLAGWPPGGSRPAARRPRRAAVRWPQRSGHRTAAHRPARRGLARDAGEARPGGGPALGPARSP